MYTYANLRIRMEVFSVTGRSVEVVIMHTEYC